MPQNFRGTRLDRVAQQNAETIASGDEWSIIDGLWGMITGVVRIDESIDKLV